MADGFFEITVVVVIAAAFGILARFLKQPTIVAYLIAGVVIAAFGAISEGSQHTLDIMATFGITLLLFLVGLEMRFDSMKTIGRAALLTGIGQIFITSLLGFGITQLLGFAVIPSLYIAFALTFSSTIVVVKLLLEKRELRTLYGRIVVGFLIVQDIVAIFILIFLSGLKSSGGSVEILTLVGTVAKSLLLFGLTYYLSKKVFPWLFDKLATSPELLFITSIAWAFGISAFVSSQWIGLSVEIGGFLAGIALARSLEQYQIASQLRPLRDFFILIFFIVLGSTIIIGDIRSVIIPAIILSLFVLIANPIILMIIMGRLRFRRKTSFYAGITVAQISEFSLILMAMGLTLGQITSREVSLVTFVGVITFIISTYFILHNHALFKKLKHILRIFERKNAHEDIPLPSNPKSSIILVGAHRLGGHLLRSIGKQKMTVVEFDPVIAKKLIQNKYNVVFGDITDSDIQDTIHLNGADLLISTIPSIDDNLALLDGVEKIRESEKKAPIVVVTAYSNWEAEKLYHAGANYVILPHFVSGVHLASLIKNGGFDITTMRKWRKHDIQVLGLKNI